MDLLVELLQVSLGTRDELSQAPNDNEWAQVLQEVQRQSVLCFFVDGLERLSTDQLPPQQLLLQWIGLAQMIEAAYALQCGHAKELTEIFRKEGFQTCILKGVGLSQLYPNASRRQGGDIDLWVKGDRKTIVAWLKQKCAVDHMLWHHIDAKFFEDMPTEIHYHPCWLYNPFCNKSLQKWVDSKSDGQLKQDVRLGFAYPTVQFNAVYSLVHFYHHLIEEGVGLRYVVDYFFILKALPVEDQTSTVATLRHLRLYKLASAVMWVLKEVCAMSEEYLICEPNEKEGRFLFDEIMRGGNFGHHRTDNRRRNSSARLMSFLPHYPGEVLWVVPWKLWHMGWRRIHHG